MHKVTTECVVVSYTRSATARDYFMHKVTTECRHKAILTNDDECWHKAILTNNDEC